ncbi:permease [Amorphus sp. 3PC139-8]|uniref:permease n=1 Tax=Amorphus sp. 3PC139-8 TaxID=2735676 RepID=UPI00345D519A
MDDHQRTDSPSKSASEPDAGKADDRDEVTDASKRRSPPKRRRIDWSILAFVILAIVAAVAIWRRGGPAEVVESATEAGWTIVAIVPQLVLGILVASFAQAIVPRDKVARALGTDSGMKGLMIATFMGTIMPGGPFASFPIVVALAQAGADTGALVTFVTAWATVSLARLFVWEVPFMGLDFGLLRFLASLPLPIIAGLIARALCRAYPSLRLTGS